MNNYIADELGKHNCLNCEEQFIVSEHVKNKVSTIYCPYCKSQNTEAIVWLESDEVDNLGCFGIYHIEEGD